MKLDIAPFAYRDTDPGGRCLTFRWEEPRDLHRVVIRFASDGDLPRPRDIEIAYWKSNWPEVRTTFADLSKGSISWLGWRPRDDWFNGEWRVADVVARAKEREIAFTFAPLGRCEFPDLRDDYSVRFRTAIQLRIRLPEGCASATGVSVLTDTPLKSRGIAVELGCGRQIRPAWDGEVQVYNGVLQQLLPPDADEPRLRLKVACAQAGPLSADHTIVTVRSTAAEFSFRPDDLDEGPIWAPDLCALVTDAASNLRCSPESVSGFVTGASTYDRIAKHPEQSLQSAVRDQKPKDNMHFVVGCEGGRQKFGIVPNGDIFAHIGFVRSVRGADTGRVGWDGNACSLRFGWNDWLPNGRRLVRGYLPLLEEGFTRGALDIHQEVFAAPLDQSILDHPIAADATIICFCRLTFRNTGAAPVTITQPLSFVGLRDVPRGSETPVCTEQLDARGDEIWVTAPNHYLRMLADTGGKGAFKREDDSLSYRLELPAGSNHSIALKIPFICLLTADEVGRLRAKDFKTERGEVIEYWERRIATAAEVVTPDQDINDFSRALITHILINDDREVGSDRIIGRVSSFHYGNYSNESIMQILELERRGFHDEARRHLDTYLHYQGTVALPGNFQSKDGIFYGSGGYEHGDYNQHHGWVLWGLAEHYRFTGDRGWLLRIADKLIAGCDWVIGERQATKRTDASGKRVLEYGFLPAGSLEDVKDFCYWLSTNCLTYRGLSAAAAVLTDAGHPEGPRLTDEARCYREDLLAGYRESMVRSPVVRLRDGTCVPHFPSRLYLRGRDFGWIREVLEGAICLTTTVLDPNSPESTWIMKDFEDNLYLDAPFNYPLQDFEREWFSCGGFSMQPNLVYFLPPYLFRDQIERFLRAYFNMFASTFRRDIRAMAEHEMPTLVEWAGDHFKSSDESMSAMWLRIMFIQEDGDTLYLGRGLPRAWVGSPTGIAIRSAATHFGPMSFEMQSLDEGSRIIARIDPPTRKPPARIVLRFRHPRKARLSRVLLNGEPVTTFDADKEWVILPALQGPTTVEAHFAEG